MIGGYGGVANEAVIKSTKSLEEELKERKQEKLADKTATGDLMWKYM